MSNAKTFQTAELALASPCSSPTALTSSDGVLMIRVGSSTPCCTTVSNAMPRLSGLPNDDPVAQPSTLDLPGQANGDHHSAHVTSIAIKINTAADQPTLHCLFLDGMSALGASSALFVSFERDDRSLTACRLMLACDPAWGHLYVNNGDFARDPWLGYAAQHSEPIVASALDVKDPDQCRVVDHAAKAGFVSALLIPVHTVPRRSRISLLCLGSAEAGYFEGEGLATLRVSARMLALELHDWWLARIRRDLLLKAHIAPHDLVLLQHQSDGHSSKKIASELRVSKESINSRFQRMNTKLGVRSRRKAVQLAIECGLIVQHSHLLPFNQVSSTQTVYRDSEIGRTRETTARKA